MAPRKKKKKMKNLILFDGGAEDVQFNFSAENEVVIFRKQILKYGEYTHPQNRDKTITFDDEYFDEIIKAFNDGAIEKVGVLIGTHDEEKTEQLAGRVIGLEKVEDKGLYAIMEIGDDEIIEKIETKLSDGKGVIDEVSVLVSPFKNDEGNSYKAALFHVAIVTHSWFTGMDSFERISAMVKAEDKDAQFLVLQSVLSLDEEANKVRQAFYESLPDEFDRYDYWLEGVYESYIIVNAHSVPEFIKYNYTEANGQITFDTGIRVEKEFQEVETMETTDLIAGLKEQGIEIDSIDTLKAKITAKEEADAETEKVKQKATESENTIKQMAALLNPEGDKGEGGEEEDIKILVAKLVVSSNEKDKEIEQIKASMVEKDAEHAVADLVNEGKVVPAYKEHFVSLYKQNKDLFESITASLSVEVKTGAEGMSGGTTDNEGGDIDPVKEAQRILAAYAKPANKEGE